MHLPTSPQKAAGRRIRRIHVWIPRIRSYRIPCLTLKRLLPLCLCSCSCSCGWCVVEHQSMPRRRQQTQAIRGKLNALWKVVRQEIIGGRYQRSGYFTSWRIIWAFWNTNGRVVGDMVDNARRRRILLCWRCRHVVVCSVALIQLLPHIFRWLLNLRYLFLRRVFMVLRLVSIVDEVILGRARYVSRV